MRFQSLDWAVSAKLKAWDLEQAVCRWPALRAGRSFHGSFQIADFAPFVTMADRLSTAQNHQFRLL
jgi:hypothetical protein